MNIAEFTNQYYLHDSSIEKVDFDPLSKTLKLTIDFCFWLQNWYNETLPKNGLIEVTFNNVTHYSYEGYDSDMNPEILDAETADNMLILYTFEFVRYEPGEDLYPVMKIGADDITVSIIEKL